MTTLERLRATLTAAEQALADFDKAYQLGPTDPGTHSMNRHKTERQMGRDVQRFVNKMGREMEARDRLERVVLDAVRALDTEEQRLRDESVAHTLDHLPTARIVRTRTGWHAVKQVNRKTVTVWDRDWAGKPVGRTIPMDRIKEARA